MRIRSRARKFAVTGVVLGALVCATQAAIPAALASTPAPTCYQYGCDYQDPIATNCADSAYTVKSVPLTIGSYQVGVLNLRYSAACGTNWAQVVITDGSTPEIQVQVCNDNDGHCSAEYTVYNSQYAYSDQVYAKYDPATAYGWVTYSGAGTFNQVTA